MSWWGALVALLDPALITPGHVMVGLAVVLAALVVAAAVALPLPRPAVAPGLRTAARRAGSIIPRLLDPDAAGRPRSRAPSLHP